MLSVDKTSDVPLYRQVYSSLRQSILSGVWKPGERIPSIRNIMSDLGISRNTVVNACQQLCAEGYIESRHGAGYFVADISFDLLRNPGVSALGFEESAKPRSGERKRWACDFSYGDLRPGIFPLNAWRKLIAEVLCGGNEKDLSSYGEHRGDWGLRYEIARYLDRSRGVSCQPGQIVVTSGVQESVGRLLGIFDASCNRFAMENPGFQGVRLVAQDAGFSIAPFPSDASDEVLLRALDACAPKIIYMTPSNQMPTGAYLTIDTRIKLLELAMRHDAYILEDDYDSIYRFNAAPIPTLKSLDRWDRVIYMGSFSKILSPALRMGCLVLPPSLVERYVRHFERYRCSVPWIEQETMRLFMERGFMERHVRRTELDVRSRHRLLVDEVDRQMPDAVELLGRESGLHLLLAVRNGMVQEELVETAAARGVRICDTRRYWSDPAESPDDLVMLGYSCAQADDIPEGVRLLREAWFPS